MSLFTTEVGEVISLNHVVAVEPTLTVGTRSKFIVHLAGGYHFEVDESFKSRVNFLADLVAA